MSQEITILVATMSGTAELVAEEAESCLRDGGWGSRIVRMDEFDVADLRPGIFLICTSTYGTGDLPDNGKPLYAALETKAPRLNDVLYGVIGLGDSIYPNTFCFGGKRFDELFQALGATPVGERLNHDRRSGAYPEDAAREWVVGWMKLLAQRCTECPVP